MRTGHRSSALSRWLTRTTTLMLLLLPARSLAQGESLDEPWLSSTPQLTGDWLGKRTTLAERGITLAADNTSFTLGNPVGGVQQNLDFGGHGDYVLTADLGKQGVREGLYLKLRAEHRFGQTIVNDAGCFISPTLIADLPVFESERMYLTNVLLTQSLNDRLAVFAGKMDTLDGDTNALAHARGKTQFSNMAFVFNPIVGATVPYSTLGAGFVVLHQEQPLFTFTVLNATDTSGTSGFAELFNEAVLLSAALRLPTRFWDMPGHQFFGATWNSQLYTSIREAYIPYPDVAIPATPGSWALFWNFDQYLVVDADDERRGWGAFGRAGLADVDTSPMSWFLSFGLGGNVPSATRGDDTFGVGWYFAAASPEIGTLISSQFGPIGSGQGIECYYNYQWTPAIRLTPDLQYIIPALKEVEPSLILGLRCQLIF